LPCTSKTGRKAQNDVASAEVKNPGDIDFERIGKYIL
jgi:hypothetical protein